MTKRGNTPISHADRMREIAGRIWFGTQYWRPPNPEPRHWEADFARMKDTGLDAARLWIYWRWHERQPGEYNFKDTDALFELGAKHGVRIHPLLFLESVPEWFIRQFPATWYVTENRQPHYPLNRKSTQIGGMAVCNNHPLFKEWAGRFLQTFVQRYRRHPALLCWDVWNELQTKSVEFVCCCPHCQREYSDDMRKRYGSLDALNAAWQTCYGRWEDVVPPNGNSDYAAWYAWRRWQAKSLGRQAQWRAAVIRTVDPDQVVMIHMPTNLDLPGHGCGDWKTGTAGMDFAGNSTHIQRSRRASGSLAERLSARTLLCITHDITAQQAPNFGWACEVSSDASSYDAPPPVHLDDFAYWIWKPISLGLKGVLFWQFHPETYGPESPDLGLIELDGSDSQRAGVVRRIGGIVQSQRDLFVQAIPPKPRIGVLVSAEQHMASCTLYNKKDGRQLYQRSVTGFYNALRQAGLPVAIVPPERLAEAGLDLLLVPRSPATDPALRDTLLDYLRQGGTAVVEGGFMTADGESFILRDVTPGMDFSKTFGLRDERAVSTRWYGLRTGADEGNALTQQEIEDMWLEAGVTAQRSESVEKLNPALRFAIEWDGQVFRCSAGFDRRPLRAATATVIGRFDTGEPAVALTAVGKGRVFYVGTAASFTNEGYGGGYGRFLLRLAVSLGIQPPLPIQPAPGITWRVLEAKQARLLFVFNHLEKETVVSLRGCGSVEILFGPADALHGDSLRCGALSTTVAKLG